ncbi:MAG: hypothetical protein WAM88_08850 [Nitrososphaeraceae archaeon]
MVVPLPIDGLYYSPAILGLAPHGLDVIGEKYPKSPGDSMHG